MPQLFLHLTSVQEELTLNIQESVLLGRDAGLNSEDTLRIDLSPHHAYALGVSRRHALLVWEQDHLMVLDLSSANGTFLNGERLIPHQAYRVEENDELVLGSFNIQISMKRKALRATSQLQVLASEPDNNNCQILSIQPAKKIIRLLERQADGTLG
jgi:pSer/pThr/pTyr-binding forkhead associated (FHA) protein